MAHKYISHPSKSLCLLLILPPLSFSSGLDGGIKMRPSSAELEAFGPEFKKRWGHEFKDKPDKPVLGHAIVSMYVFPLLHTGSGGQIVD